MNPFVKEIIDKLNNEKDSETLAEVLGFYEYIKQKKEKELKRKWSQIEEDEPTEDEIKLYKEYKNNKEESIPLDSVEKE
ncbi:MULTISPECIES: hypothetical protein [Clostridium]|uniref:hypothetical protein n=1 Tax=Clostridium TaxID=1485 RepID=UPI0008240707|nr:MULTISPECIES: hypothetical protein [Clostridium]PJI08669.1 hypothetical protein CUB90_12690 [Clostridium sp. CT7]